MVTRCFSESGGLELYTHKLVEGLLKHGCKVSVICEQNDSSFTNPNLTIEQCIASASGLNKSQRLDHYLKESEKAIARFGPFDIVHSQHFPIEHPDVVTFHNHTVAWLSKQGKAWERLLNSLKMSFVPAYRRRDEIDQLLTENAPLLIFPSHTCKDDFETQFNLLGKRDPASHLVAYPGVDLNSQPTKNNSSPFTFLFVGRGYRKKGLDVLLAACQDLVNRGYQFQLLIAGLKEKFFNKVQLTAMGLSKNVFYLGFQKDMPAIYKKSQVLILPSRIEPFGMAPLEAMIYGLVPIVSKISGVSEILTNEKDSLILSDHLNHQGLSTLMTSLIDQPELVKKLSHQAQLTAQKYDWNKTVENTILGYQQILNKKAKYVSKSSS